MTVSLVITCYREGQLLLHAAASAEAQSDQDFEAIIVNDCSPDPETNEACRTLEKSGRWRVIWREQNGGLSAARNDGYRLMTGDVCVALDADDTLPVDVIRSVKQHFKQRPDADFVFGNYIRHELETGTEKTVDCSILCDNSGWLDSRKMTLDWIFLGTSPCRKKAWEKAGGYSNEFANASQDVDFFIRLLKAGCRGSYLNETIYVWNLSERGMCSNCPPDILARIFLHHADFYDVTCDGRAVRFDLMWQCINAGRFDNARVFARQLKGLGDRSRTVTLLSLLHPTLSKWLYRTKEQWRSKR